MWFRRLLARRTGVLLFVIFSGIVLLRFYALDARTIHIDEGMALRLGQMFVNGEWHFNPQNSHGPIFFMFAATVFRFFGDSLVMGRAGIVLFNLLWLGLLVRFYWSSLRTPGRLLLLAGLGLSSGMIFFARYMILEHIFMLWTVCALMAGEWWAKRRHPLAPAAFVASCFLMYATKETALFTWIAWIVAGILLTLDRRNEGALFEMQWSSVLVGVIVGLALHAALFSQFFRDPAGIWNSFQAPLRWWSERAQTLHVRPFWYFSVLLVVHEFPLVIIGGVSAWLLTAYRQWNPRLIFFGIWTLLIVLAYSMVPYKTPWCIPNLILPLGLFVACSVDALWPHLPLRQGNALLLAVVILVISGTIIAWQDSVVHPDRVHAYDYAYLQSDESFRHFLRTLTDLSRLYDGEKPMPLQRRGYTDELLYVITKPYRSFDSAEPLVPDLPVYINYLHDDGDTRQELEASGKRYIRSTYMYIRDWETLVDLFVEESLWNRYLREVAHEDILPGEHPVYDYSK